MVVQIQPIDYPKHQTLVSMNLLVLFYHPATTPHICILLPVQDCRAFGQERRCRLRLVLHLVENPSLLRSTIPIPLDQRCPVLGARGAIQGFATLFIPDLVAAVGLRINSPSLVVVPAWLPLDHSEVVGRVPAGAVQRLPG